MENGKKSVHNFMITCISILLFVPFFAEAQNNSLAELKNKDQAIANLVMAIHSDNPGLRRSAIYLSGKYKIAEVVPELIKQMKSEEDPTMRFLIAVVLNEIGDDEGLEFIHNFSKLDKDHRVRHIGRAIALKNSN